MSAYKGYQLMISNIKLPYLDETDVNIIEPGTYSTNDSQRLIEEWQDMDGDIHREVFSNKKTSIQFTIKERTLEQQEKILPILKKYNNIVVTYWSDSEAVYKTGLFFIESIDSLTSIATKDTIYYGETTIQLMEH